MNRHIDRIGLLIERYKWGTPQRIEPDTKTLTGVYLTEVDALLSLVG